MPLFEKALKGRNHDHALSGLKWEVCLNNRVMPYPDAVALSGQSNHEKVYCDKLK